MLVIRLFICSFATGYVKKKDLAFCILSVLYLPRKVRNHGVFYLSRYKIISLLFCLRCGGLWKQTSDLKLLFQTGVPERSAFLLLMVDMFFFDYSYTQDIFRFDKFIWDWNTYLYFNILTYNKSIVFFFNRRSRQNKCMV